MVMHRGSNPFESYVTIEKKFTDSEPFLLLLVSSTTLWGSYVNCVKFCHVNIVQWRD